MPTRDDFNPATKRRLRERVNGICSRPECRAATLGAHTDETKGAVNVGVAAHICAAAPGGPRYDETMSPDERSHLANGIWLCNTCSNLIDKDTEQFTPTVLRQWKVDAELQARTSIGRRTPTEHDARDQVASMLFGVPTSHQPNFIANAHAASSMLLEKLDPRFQVKTSFSDDVTRYELRAREPVPIRFKVRGSSAAEWQAGLSNLVRHGQAIELPADDVQMRGSPIFDQIHSAGFANGRFVFTPEGRQVVAKVSLRDPESGAIFSMDDACGTLTLGTESVTYAGASCADLFKFQLDIPRQTAPVEGSFTVSMNYDPWLGRDVNSLPFFEKLFQFYDKAEQGWEVDITLELEGNRIFGVTVHMPTDSDVFMFTHTTLGYCNRARALTKHLGKQLEFQLSPPFSAEEHQELAELADIARGLRAFKADEISELTHIAKAEADAKNIRLIQQASGSHVFFPVRPQDPISIYGQELVLPQVRQVFEDAMAQIDVDVDTIAEGDLVTIKWAKGPAFALRLEFETPAQAAEREAMTSASQGIAQN